MLSFVLVLSLGAVVFGQDEYIVGGTEVWPPGSYPWQGALESRGLVGDSYSLRCGCVYIGDQWVLTAAHCVENTDASRLRVALGAHDLVTGVEGAREYFNVKIYTYHPDWVNSGNLAFPNDVAVIELETIPVENTYIRAIPVPEAGRNEPDWVDQECVISGWGRLSGNGDLPNVLQQTPINVITQEECAERWSTSPIADYHVCLMDKDGGFQAGACNGDSGGPLVCRPDADSDWELVGVTSWGRTGCLTSYPSVYAKVSYFREWIDVIIGA